MTKPLTIWLSPHAWWHLEWLCARTPCEVSTMGLLAAPARGGFRVEDFILVRQQVGPAFVELDMAWWADKQSELFETRGAQPWQTSLWCHTHPSSVSRPSGTDEATMRRSFGLWDFALMLILTKDGQSYARVEFTHEFTGGLRRRFRLACAVAVDWCAPVAEPVTGATLERWEAEFQELVAEGGFPAPEAWAAGAFAAAAGARDSLGEPGRGGARKGGKSRERKEMQNDAGAWQRWDFASRIVPAAGGDEWGLEPAGGGEAWWE